MKRNKLPLVGLGLALAAIAIGTVGCEDFTLPSPKAQPPSGDSVSSQQNTGIWVIGEGDVSVVPDLAILSLGVETQANTVIEAQNQAAVHMDAVIGELETYDIAKKDIKIQHFSIYPVRKWVQEREEEVLVDYRVNNMVIAKVREVENTGTIIDAVTRVGGDNIRINSIKFTVDEPAVYYREAREKAIADARIKATQLADSANVKLGKPTYIQESGGLIPVPREQFVTMPSSAPAPPVTPVSPGETEIRLTVQISYSIEY